MSSDEEEIFESKKFIKVELPEDFDPNKPYKNGEEFLQWVLHETRSTPSVVKAHIDVSKFSKKKSDVFIEENNTKYRIPAEDLPSSEWQVKKLEDFKTFRKYAHFQLSNEPLFQGSLGALSQKMNEEYPDLAWVSGLTPKRIRKLLISLVKALGRIENGEIFNDFLGTWILTALTILEDPILCDIAYNLRELCKECMRIRYHLYEKNGNAFIGAEATPLNMFICIITKFFLQKDLCEA